MQYRIEGTEPGSRCLTSSTKHHKLHLEIHQHANHLGIPTEYTNLQCIMHKPPAPTRSASKVIKPIEAILCRPLSGLFTTRDTANLPQARGTPFETPALLSLCGRSLEPLESPQREWTLPRKKKKKKKSTSTPSIFKNPRMMRFTGRLVRQAQTAYL
ncbi:hypothetical protein J3459_008148 [Metarhizium acridum]|nr:hypothetical protein J3459_008148 [Metarhizium acridum]